MALTDEGSGVPATMLVSPAQQGGFGFGADGGWWIILLFILLAGGNGWGNGFGGGNGAGGMYPWLNQSNQINDGFRDQMMNGNITEIRNGVNGLAAQLCNGFAGVNANVANGFAGAEIAANSRQMANMNQMFGAQTAMVQGFNALQGQLAQCCCDNRAATADLKYTVATEACADRSAIAEALREVIAANTASTQRVLDQMCQDKIDSKNDTIAQLRQELLYARSQASQDVQTATLRAGQIAEVDALYDRLNNCPVPTTPVYGRQPIFTCGGGCGCNGNI